eukprot:6833291-Prymnesium_polylepis.1
MSRVSVVRRSTPEVYHPRAMAVREECRVVEQGGLGLGVHLDDHRTRGVVGGHLGGDDVHRRQ